MKGWTGKVLSVDLSRGEVRAETLGTGVYERFIGAEGLNAWLLWQGVPPEVEPLSPDNLLLFGFGPLVGTEVPCSNRCTVTFKSPLTGIYCDSNVGGYFPPEVKSAGYDAIIIRGRADKPVYLWINDGRAEIRDASHLWGKDTAETEDIIHKELGDPKIRVVSIGPAGENLVKYATLMANKFKAAARGGTGCVAGAKNLKAIAVRGTKEVDVADAEFLKESYRQAQELVNRPDNRYVKHFRETGTPGGMRGFNTVTGVGAARNFQDNVFDKFSDIDGETLVAKYKTRNHACVKCPIGCEQAWEIREGRFAGEKGERIELITSTSLGMVLGNNDMASILHLQNLTNRLGLDVAELGHAIAMAMECWQKGILTATDTGGIKLDWGNVDSILQLTELTARRQGFGKILAEGVRGAASIIGKGAPEFAMHVKGLSMIGEDLRNTQGWALAFAVSVRGADHLKGTPVFEKVPEAPGLCQFVWGTEEFSNMRSPLGKGRAVWYTENHKALIDSLGMCRFLAQQASAILSTQKKFDYLYRLFAAATGSSMGASEFARCGERIVQIQKAYNAREGIARKDDTLPNRELLEKTPSNPGKGLVVQLDDPGMLPEYYAFRGYGQDGLPTRQRLLEVGLDDVADELGRRDKLSESSDEVKAFAGIKKYLA